MENLDSQFLGEVDSKFVERLGLSRPKELSFERTRVVEEAPVNPNLQDDYEKVNLNLSIGDKVNHKVFGDGVVVQIQGEKATIAFSKTVGIKVLMKDHPSIQKVK